MADLKPNFQKSAEPLIDELKTVVDQLDKDLDQSKVTGPDLQARAQKITNLASALYQIGAANG